ncbi:hypothetical protein AVEN_235424-1 [Araneus ventricosus]|uniref:Uncharacterized protein n=1 Tax=Araneus ventricosus TaxID=182803 RepID=A0A4Y2A449_ARAVE|nr:hypothetical protein AVEN_235424-1 [Araneus ventricosus]
MQLSLKKNLGFVRHRKVKHRNVRFHSCTLSNKGATGNRMKRSVERPCQDHNTYTAILVSFSDFGEMISDPRIQRKVCQESKSRLTLDSSVKRI